MGRTVATLLPAACVVALVAAPLPATAASKKGLGLGAELGRAETAVTLYYGFGDVWASVGLGGSVLFRPDDTDKEHGELTLRLMYNLARTELANLVIGGGLRFDLTFDRVRTDLELVYGVHGFLAEDFAVTGTVTMAFTIQTLGTSELFMSLQRWGVGFLYFF